MIRRLASACSISLLLSVACNGDDSATGATDSSSSSTGDESTSTSTSTSGETTSQPASVPIRYFLRIDDELPPPLVLEMDKDKALEIFGETAARNLELLEVDSTQMLVNALTEIQGSCGTSWQNYSVDPKHDCTKTELGQTYGENWQVSPEFALVRMLTMTPINAVVVGSSLEPMANAFANINDPSFQELLANALDIEQTQPFISLDVLVAALKKTLLYSHPEVDNDEGRLKITLWDAVNDMQTLSVIYGPNGEHPGILYGDSDGFKTYSNALTDRFRMKVVAESNLRWVDGIDLSSGGGDMFVTDAESILTFDFLDPEKLVITGIFGQEKQIDGKDNPDYGKEPTIDMRFRLGEHMPEILPCTNIPTCLENFPDGWLDIEGNPMGIGPIGDDTIWNLKPWLLEYIVGYSALLAYGYDPPRLYEECVSSFDQVNCDAGVWIGPPSGDVLLPQGFQAGPGGWSTFRAFVEGKAPPPQFLWELLVEIAEVAIHDTNGDKFKDIEPGDANPLFALKGVGLGLSAQDMIDQIRPTMQEQADEVANVILGKYWKNNGHLDFYYRRPPAGGVPYLYFVAESDLRPDPNDPDTLATYTYTRPGFFSCRELTDDCKVSSTDITGVADTNHEKYLLPKGESTLYVEDDEGKTYEVGFYVPSGPNPTEIIATVRAL